jgi:prevent-host-death family protein
METWPMTEARAQLPTLLEKVRSGHWQLIGRRGRPEVVVAEAGEMEALLAPVFRFRPEADIDEGDVGVYLFELDVHGVGATLDEALVDLAEVMLEYAEDWVDHLRHAPNHAPRAGYVRRIEIAGATAGVVAMLNADADAEAEAQAASSGKRPEDPDGQ